jgi:beta-galactosidase
MRFGLPLCILAMSPLLSKPVEHNLARDARAVRSSLAAPRHDAGLAADGIADTFWEAPGSPSEPAWIEFEWDHPAEIREVVIRRYLPEKDTSDITSARIQVLADGTWQTIQTLGDGRTPLPAIMLARLSPIKAHKMRISELAAPVWFTEVEIYSEASKPALDVRGDAKGNIIGVFTDAFGAQGIHASFSVTGTAGNNTWRQHFETNAAGDFSIPMPVGLTGQIAFAAKVDGQTFQRTLDAADIHQGLVPKLPGGATLLLNGAWKFMPDPPSGFERHEFADQSWSKVEVPSHWEMAGFHARSGVGGYRKEVSIPAQWKGQRIRLSFEGVYSAAEIWCNGTRVGSHTGGATPFQLDITSCAKPGVKNLFAVRVKDTSEASELDHMSTYADFSLGGIFRSASVFAVPTLHVARIHSFTEFDSSYHAATLVTDVTIVNESDIRARARVSLKLSESQKVVGRPTDPVTFDLEPWSKADRRIRIDVSDPLPWSAEHPNLYTLTASLSDGDRPISTVSKAVGFRETKVRGKELRLNGVPIKLKGTCHHDSHPLMGRAVTPELERQDLLLIKEANLDAVRTSHYPPIPELLDIADELGVYVEEEAPFCWVNNADDLRLKALVRQLTSEMVERDASHPSVVYWSSANESRWGPSLTAGEQMIRESDPTRPVIGSWWDRFDMEVHHNPITVELLQKYEDHSKPIIWDESLCIWQGIWDDAEELLRDPGYRDYYIAPLLDVWDTFWHSKTTQASFIWAWSDDLFMVPGRASDFGRSHEIRHAIDGTYREPGRGLVGDAPWGVVDGWRRRKPEFWHVKELHSPIKVTSREIPLPTGKSLRIPVENRYFFTNLSEIETRWKLDGHNGKIHAAVGPQQTGSIELPLPFTPSPGSLVELQFIDSSGRMVDVAEVRIGQPPADLKSNSNFELTIEERRNLADEATVISGAGFELAFSARSGLLRYGLAKGQTVLYDQPSVSVLPMDDAMHDFPARLTWAPDGGPSVDSHADRVTITTKGHYRDLVGTYRTTIMNNGQITFAYDFRYTGPEIRVRESGAKFGVPLSIDQLTWKRRGEWTWYPPDHIAALDGSAKAHSGRPMSGVPDWPFGEDDSPAGTNAFRSTKRNILSAAILDADGLGVRIASDGSQHLRASVDADRIDVRVSDWFGGSNSEANEWTDNYHNGKVLGSGDSISGKVILSLETGPALHANR